MRVRGKIDTKGLSLAIPPVNNDAVQVFKLDCKTPDTPVTPKVDTVGEVDEYEMSNPQRFLPSTALFFKSLSEPATDDKFKFLFLYNPDSPSPKEESKEEMYSDVETASCAESEEKEDDLADSCYSGYKRPRLS